MMTTQSTSHLKFRQRLALASLAAPAQRLADGQQPPTAIAPARVGLYAARTNPARRRGATSGRSSAPAMREVRDDK
eukprot:3466560-Pleurochrysis_carterae.AAC.1